MQSVSRRHIENSGGPETKIHALSDNQGRPLAFHLAGANVSDFTDAEALLPLIPQGGILHGDMGYDSDRIRRALETKGAFPNIPPRKTRKWKNCFSPYLYKSPNVIERRFGRLKEFRRIATRHDCNARNFLSAPRFVATVCYWLLFLSLVRSNIYSICINFFSSKPLLSYQSNLKPFERTYFPNSLRSGWLYCLTLSLDQV